MPATKLNEILWIHSMGKRFRLRGVFDTDEETNAYLKNNHDTGVITVAAEHIFVANLYEGV